MKSDHPKEIIIDGVKYAPIEEPIKLPIDGDKNEFIKRIIENSSRRETIMRHYDDINREAIKYAMMQAENLSAFTKMSGINIRIDATDDGDAYIGVSWGYIYPEIHMMKRYKEEWQDYD